MPDSVQSWSVIIFCYNEAGTVQQVAEDVQQFFRDIHCEKNELIIVDDGSSDGSTEIIREVEKKWPNVKAVYHEKNKGIGQALRSGYAAAQYENVTALPADAQFSTKELVPHAFVPEGSFVSFFRKENTVYSLKRNILSYFNKMVNSFFLGIRLRDVNWVKIYKGSELKKLNLKMKSSLVESEICSKLILRKNKVIEEHSVYHQRKAGVSKGASGKIVMQAVREMLKLIFVITIYRFKSK